MSYHVLSNRFASDDCSGSFALFMPFSSYHCSTVAAICACAFLSWKINGSSSSSKMLSMYGYRYQSGIARNVVLPMIRLAVGRSPILWKHMPPKSTTDTESILTSVRFPGSFSVLKLHHTIVRPSTE